eukprot:NODE_692_length_4692_cov_0.413238.p4 type:complete len:127 gc:universal NODE_692_length_4692_cov_0.413238:2232-2612(+)
MLALLIPFLAVPSFNKNYHFILKQGKHQTYKRLSFYDLNPDTNDMEEKKWLYNYNIHHGEKKRGSIDTADGLIKLLEIFPIKDGPVLLSSLSCNYTVSNITLDTFAEDLFANIRSCSFYFANSPGQ